MFPKKCIDNRVKNTKRKITLETKYKVWSRDRFCISCKGPIEEYHHVYYGASANYGPNRNHVDQLVGLCNICHDKLHSRGRKDLRDYCIHYLKEFYGNLPKTPNSSLD